MAAIAACWPGAISVIRARAPISSAGPDLIAIPNPIRSGPWQSMGSAHNGQGTAPKGRRHHRPWLDRLDPRNGALEARPRHRGARARADAPDDHRFPLPGEYRRADACALLQADAAPA